MNTQLNTVEKVVALHRTITLPGVIDEVFDFMIDRAQTLQFEVEANAMGELIEVVSKFQENMQAFFATRTLWQLRTVGGEDVDVVVALSERRLADDEPRPTARVFQFDGSR